MIKMLPPHNDQCSIGPFPEGEVFKLTPKDAAEYLGKKVWVQMACGCYRQVILGAVCVQFHQNEWQPYCLVFGEGNLTTPLPIGHVCHEK